MATPESVANLARLVNGQQPKDNISSDNCLVNLMSVCDTPLLLFIIALCADHHHQRHSTQTANSTSTTRLTTSRKRYPCRAVSFSRISISLTPWPLLVTVTLLNGLCRGMYDDDDEEDVAGGYLEGWLTAKEALLPMPGEPGVCCDAAAEEAG